MLDAIPKMFGHLGRLLRPHPTADWQDMHGKTVVVTGASQGSIGFITAVTLAKWGANVIASCRSEPEKLQQALLQARGAGGGDIQVLALDLSNFASVENFARAIEQSHKNIDVLINNAGVHLDLLGEWKQGKRTDDGEEIHWRTNYLGTFHLTEQLLPLLLNAAEARVINVVSHLHVKGKNAYLFADYPYHSWTAYGTSKLALLHHAIALHERYAAQGLKTAALHPGSIYTNISHKGLNGHPWLQRIKAWLAPLEAAILLSPEQGAQTQIDCAANPALASGAYYQRLQVAQASSETRDKVARDTLWQQSQNWLAQAQETA